MIVGGTESPEHQMQNDYYRHLVHLTHELSLDEVILFLGDRKDVYELLNASDVFVLSSLWEGIPNALLEAMTVGLPSVSTRVGGVPEIVKDGHSGVLVDPQDPESLAISMMDLIRNPRISTVIARNAQADVRENMNWDVMASRTISVYENLLQVYN